MEQRFRANLERLGLARPGTRIVVALSGGRDSVVLLHLLRFATPELSISAAHLDHAMRPDSAADARWVAGLCRAWGIELLRERLPAAPASETEARRARYQFLRGVREQLGAEYLATAHHADDQAETVLFRALRGTGPTGLTGIPATGPGGLVRPLLPFWRAEIARYARAAGLRWREDPSNRSLGPVRNRIRQELLPRIERSIAPGARRNLVRLAGLARDAEAGWQAVVAPLEAAAVEPAEGGAVVLARDLLRDYHGPVATRILRNQLRRFGIVLGRAGTRAALQFTIHAPSGRELQLPDGVRIRTEWDRARIERARELPPDQPLRIGEAPAEGVRHEGRVRIGGRECRVRWWVESRSAAAAEHAAVALRLDALRFPLLLRGWSPGDRTRTAGGSKTLKKLFGERRVPRSRRTVLPLLADAAGEVVWVEGVSRAPDLAPRAGQRALFLVISDA